MNIDTEKMVAEVWAGTKLHELGKLLEEKGYAQENLGILIRNLLQEQLVRVRMERYYLWKFINTSYRDYGSFIYR